MTTDNCRVSITIKLSNAEAVLILTGVHTETYLVAQQLYISSCAAQLLYGPVLLLVVTGRPVNWQAITCHAGIIITAHDTF